MLRSALSALDVPSSPQHLEISSFGTTVRRRPDRSRPPQVGAEAHTCTAYADPTAPAGPFRASQPPPFQTPAIFGNAHIPAGVLPNRRSREAETGGRGGNYFPRMPFLPFCLSCLSGGRAEPRCSCLILSSQPVLSVNKRILRKGGLILSVWKV